MGGFEEPESYRDYEQGATQAERQLGTRVSQRRRVSERSMNALWSYLKNSLMAAVSSENAQRWVTLPSRM